MSHRYRMYPTNAHEATMQRHCADARFVWNLALEQFGYYRPHAGPTPNWVERSRQLTEARRGTWLGEGSADVQGAALRDFDRAVKHWWAGTHGRPTWRKRFQREGFVIRHLVVEQITRKWATVWVPKCGPVKFRLSRALPEKYGQARVTLDRAGRWHVSFSAPQPAVVREATGATIGLDLGVATTVTTSDGGHLHAPTLSQIEQRRRVHLQRKMARQCKGSARRERTRLEIAKLNAREADRRNDWIEKTTTALVRDHDLISTEDLNVAGMVRSAKGTLASPGSNVAAKRGLNRSIQAQAWGQFRSRLEQKAQAATSPVIVVAVNPANTSRLCHACGHVEKDNRKSQAVFRCVSCGHSAHADVNAALNILAAGRAVIGRGGTQRPDEASTPIAGDVNVLMSGATTPKDHP